VELEFFNRKRMAEFAAGRLAFSVFAGDEEAPKDEESQLSGNLWEFKTSA